MSRPLIIVIGLGMVLVILGSVIVIASQSTRAAADLSLRSFDVEEVESLGLHPYDVPDGRYGADPKEPDASEYRDDAWQDHLRAHGLRGRWWSGISRGEPDGRHLPWEYGFIIGSRVSLWRTQADADEALEYENSRSDALWSRPEGGPLIDVPALGEGAWCGVLDGSTAGLADRAWCRFRTSNATLDLYIRTSVNGDDSLHPHAMDRLKELALVIFERNLAAAAERE